MASIQERFWSFLFTNFLSKGTKKFNGTSNKSTSINLTQGFIQTFTSQSYKINLI
jgi:hypothetical protein